jgi:hypothetical protein
MVRAVDLDQLAEVLTAMTRLLGEGHSFHVSAMGHLVRSLEGQQS